ncbi:uncharacterized protein LOC118771014 isoform X2 [Megalops cyprinoides]|uniref:uncharacterized protein LOC118771014 isoform X2 n=1 Tax=Megalops cyprinoides TaxID=118141 RepID=UPI001864CBA4|nr:uncharacterized protein LOC118771014 isoform X2 [Megalops cyprinoides]
MTGRVLLLFAALCVGAGLCGAAAVTKVVRRRGVRTHAPMVGGKKPTDQWDSSIEGKAVPPLKLSGLIGRAPAGDTQLVIQTGMAQSNEAALVSNSNAVPFESAHSALKLEQEPLHNQDSPLLVSEERGGVDLAWGEAQNGTRGSGSPSEQDRNDKALHRKLDLGARYNKTRFKPLIRSRARPDLTVYAPASQARGLILDLSRKSNFSVSHGPLIAGLREKVERRAKAQPQGQTAGGLSSHSWPGRSRKRDLIGFNHSQSETSLSEQEQERAVTLGLPGVSDQTVHPHPIPDTSAVMGSNQPAHPGSGVVGDAAGGFAERVKEAVSSDEDPPSKSKRYPAHTTLTSNTESILLLTEHTPTLPVTPGLQGERNQSSGSHNGSEPDNGAGHGEEPQSRTSVVPADGLGHVLRLRPNPEPDWGAHAEGVGGGVTVDSWLDAAGLVFEEAEDGRGQGGAGSRSRSRRSWIWNQFFVIEEYSGPEPVLIGRLHTDMDRGDGRTKYILRGEGAGSVFVIDEKTGNIHVTKPLDREEKDEYRLIATATDRQTDRALEPSSQFIIRVQDINDNPPVFEDGPYSATVPEMANIGTSIIQVTATDADDPTYGNSARLVYTLIQGQQFFSVDPQTGILRTAVPDMDRETQDEYLVVLQAKDMGGHLGGLSGTTTVTVKLSDVNDNPPRFTQSIWSFSVSELAVPGAEVGRLSAMDADLGDNAKLEYTILEGESGDTFNITGLNQEAIIILNKAVDYESRSSYSFSVEVLNPSVDPRFLRRGPFKDRASVRVAVLDADEPPRFSRARYRLDVSENCPPSCTVGRVSAVDPDTGLNSNIRYSIDPQSDPEALFRISPDSGLIATAMELDREHEQWHNLTVIATQRDSPNQVSRVVVAIETLDVNDNAPELDRQYTTALCDSATVGQVVQVLRAIDKDTGGNDTAVHFSIPAASSAAQNFSVRQSGGPTASLVLLSPLPALSRSPSSSLSLQVPLVLKDSMSGLTSTGTVTVSVCPCLRGGARAEEKDGQTAEEWERETVCLPMPSSSPSPGLSTAALLAILACVATLLAVSALSLSLRRQKRDSLSPLEEDDVRENIITYDDEGGGEADTAAFDITALQSAPHGTHRGYRTLDSRNIRFSQQNQDKSGTYSWAQSGGVEGQYPGPAPLYGRLCYSSHTLPSLRHARGPFGPGPGLSQLACPFPIGPLDHSLIIQNQGALLGQAEPQGERAGPPAAEDRTPHSTDTSDREPEPKTQPDPDQSANWNHSLPQTQTDPPAPLQVPPESLAKDRTLVQTRSGVAGPAQGSWACDSATLPSAGRRASRASLSPKRTGGVLDPAPPAVAMEVKGHGDALSRGYASVLHGDLPREYPGSLGRGGRGLGTGFMVARPEMEGGISVTGTTCGLYPERAGFVPDWRDRVGLGTYTLGRRDMTPQLLPFPGQNRAMIGQLGYRGGWGLGAEPGRGGANSLALRVGEFLRLRLAQVTFDPTQPPYDSVQIYGLEGEGSRAGSLSSLESEGEKEGDKEWFGGVEEWGPQFQRLAELFREREREKEEEKEKEGEKEEKKEEVAREVEKEVEKSGDSDKEKDLERK